MKFLESLHQFLEGNKLISGLLLFLISFSLFVWFQNSPRLPDPDSFYHIKISTMMAEGGIVKDFPYLPFTILKDNYIDHHFLYHVLMVPFVIFLPPLVGAKLFQAIMAALAIVVFFWLLKKIKVNGAFWYGLLLLLIPGFIFRINLIKAQPLSLILLFAGIYLILSRRYWLLSLLAFIYVWSYDGWFLILILALLDVFTESALAAWEKKSWKKFFTKSWSLPNLKLIGCVAGGLIAGIILNPYFPQNLNFYYVHIFQIGLVNFQSKIGVGAEWYPFSFGQFLQNAYFSIIGLILASALYLTYWRKMGPASHFLFLVAALFSVAVIRSRRNIEYFVPVSLIFTAVIFSATRQNSIIKTQLAFIPKWFKKIITDRWLAIFLGCVILFLINALIVEEKMSLNKGRAENFLKPAAQYLSQHSKPGDFIFSTDWDRFPPLFYHNTQNRYLDGLDPTFMYLYNPDLYQKSQEIIHGERAGEMRRILIDDFQAKFILTNHREKKLLENLENNFYFKKAYEDSEAIIYQIL